MADAQVIFNKIRKHDYILKVDRKLSEEYFFVENDVRDPEFYSLVINSEGKVSDFGKTEESIFGRICEECADEEKEYEITAPAEFFQKIGKKLMKGETEFAHKF